MTAGIPYLGEDLYIRPMDEPVLQPQFQALPVDQSSMETEEKSIAGEALVQTVGQVEAIVSQNSDLAQEQHSAGIASAETERNEAISLANARFSSQEASLQARLENVTGRLAEITLALNDFKSLCIDRRAALDEAILDEKRQVALYEAQVEQIAATHTQVRENRNELQKKASHMDALIATTEALIAHRSKEIERFSAMYAKIADAAVERREKADKDRDDAQHGAAEQMSLVDIEADSINDMYLRLQQEGAGPDSYGQDFTFYNEDRQDTTKLDEITAKIGSLTKAKNKSSDDLAGYNDGLALFNADIVSHIAQLQHLTAQRKDAALQASNHKQELAYYVAEAHTLDVIEGLDLENVDDVSDLLRAPFDAARQLASLLQKKIIVDAEKVNKQSIPFDASSEREDDRSVIALRDGLRDASEHSDIDVIQIDSRRGRSKA